MVESLSDEWLGENVGVNIGSPSKLSEIFERSRTSGSSRRVEASGSFGGSDRISVPTYLMGNLGDIRAFRLLVISSPMAKTL